MTKEELNELTENADSGDAEALYKLGDLYFYGEEVEESYEKALCFYSEAEKRGHTKATYSIGWLYEHALGVAKSYAVAIEHYTRGAEQGSIDSMYRLGAIYYDDEESDIKREPKKSLFWFEKAAEAGELRAYSFVGRLYEEEFQNFEKARIAYEKGLQCENEVFVYACLCGLQSIISKKTPESVSSIPSQMEDLFRETQKSDNLLIKRSSKLLEAAIYISMGIEYIKALNLANEAAELGCTHKNVLEEKLFAACANLADNEDFDFNYWLAAAERYYNGINGTRYLNAASISIDNARKKYNSALKIEELSRFFEVYTLILLDHENKCRCFPDVIKMLTFAIKVPDSEKTCPRSWYLLGKHLDTTETDERNSKKAQYFLKLAAEHGNQDAKQYLKKFEPEWIQEGLCRHCGGTFKGIFKKSCTECYTPKDY